MFRKEHYVVLPPETGDTRYVPIESDPIVVGRAHAARIRLFDTAVSGSHCRIFREGDQVYVEDLGSTNGTFIDDRRVEGRSIFPVGAILQVGRNLLRHEVLDFEEIHRRQSMSAEMQRATSYVRSLLPAAVTDGPVRAEWRFIPCATLGGDAFGYHWLDRKRFGFFLLDVCGHGAAAALHSVSVIHALRKQNLRGVDFTRPDQVLSGLNQAFPMEEHGRMFLTAWYGVWDRESRLLTFAAGGHPPALLASPDQLPRLLLTDDLPVGMMRDSTYALHEAEVPPGSRLVVYSDGTFEVRTREGSFLEIDELHAILGAAPEPGRGEAERIERAIRGRMREHDFPDDFSLLCLKFV